MVAVSSLRFWKERGGQTEAVASRRAVDPLWLLVLLAAVLAALALAQPRWIWANAPATPQAEMQWSVRSISGEGGSEHIEAWARLAPGSDLPPGQAEIGVNDRAQAITAAQLRNGIALPVPEAKGGHVALALLVNHSELARQEFVRGGTDESFGLLEYAGAGKGIDPALHRAFSVQSGARIGEPSLERTVVIVNDPKMTQLDFPPRALVLAEPATPLEGINPGNRIEAPSPSPGGWSPEVAAAPADPRLTWPAIAPLEGIRVRALRDTAISRDWQVLATAGGRPWILGRETGDGGTLVLWLASEPATETDWPGHASFIVFLAEMEHRAWGDQGGSQYIAWTPLHSPEAAATQTQASLELGNYCGGLAVALLLIAAAWCFHRIGHTKLVRV